MFVHPFTRQFSLAQEDISHILPLGTQTLELKSFVSDLNQNVGYAWNRDTIVSWPSQLFRLSPLYFVEKTPLAGIKFCELVIFISGDRLVLVQ